MNKIKELEDTIKQAAKEYYTGKKCSLTDNQFDTLVESLRILDPNNKLLSIPGWGFTATKTKEELEFSLPKPMDRVKSDLNSLPLFKDPIYSIKLDGVSCCVSYNYGKFEKATTREGLIITHHIKSLVPNTIPFNIGKIVFRGEVVIKKELFNSKYKGVFANARSFVSGKVNQISINPDINDLEVIFFQLQGYDCDPSMIPNTKIGLLRMINNQRLKVVDYIRATNNPIDSTSDITYKFLDSWAQSSPYLVDGIVITENELNDKEENSVIFKFKDDEVDIIVKSVSHATGSTGRVIPVLNFDPVELEGANIVRATAHNEKYLLENKIDVGAVVTICRSNQVIPYIIKIVIPAEKVNLPTECPACNTKLDWKDSDLFCPSMECPAKEYTVLKRLFFRSGLIEGCADTTIQEWLESFPILNDVKVNILNIADFLAQFKQSGPKSTTNRLNLLISTFGGHKGKLLHQLEKNIENKLNNGITYEEFWYCLNLPALAEANSKKLKDINPLQTTLQKIQLSGVNSAVVDSLIKYQDRWIQLSTYWSNLYPIINPPPEENKVINGKYSGLVYCMTGERNKELSKFLIENGAIEKDGVSKDLTLLITKDINSTSSKAQLARKRNIEIITLEDALKRFT